KTQKVVEAIKAAFPAHVSTFAKDPETGRTDYDTVVPQTDPRMLPEILDNFDDGVEFTIVWESGSPYCWTYLFPHGGVDEEFGSVIKNVQDLLPAGVRVEPMTSYSLGLFFEKA